MLVIADAAAKVIARMRRCCDLDPVKAPQRQGNLIGKRGRPVRMGADAVEGQQCNCRPIERSKDRQWARRRCAYASGSPQRRRRGFAIAPPILGREAPEMVKTTTCRDFCDARFLAAAK